jgi:hypothetical protein
MFRNLKPAMLAGLPRLEHTLVFHQPHENYAMSSRTKMVKISASLTDAQAGNLAQFLKRVGFSEFRSNAQDEQEAYAMRDAADIIRGALAEKGYAPR